MQGQEQFLSSPLPAILPMEQLLEPLQPIPLLFLLPMESDGMEQPPPQSPPMQPISSLQPQHLTLPKSMQLTLVHYPASLLLQTTALLELLPLISMEP